MRRFLAVATALALHLSAQAKGFEECPQFFPNKPPAVAQPADQRALCFRSFAVLYSGQSKTPVYAAERLSRVSLSDAANEKRTNRFYPEARLPSAVRSQLDDYKGSGWSRGHMQYPVKSILVGTPAIEVA
jgi:endonuclease G, mitochondrial